MRHFYVFLSEKDDVIQKSCSEDKVRKSQMQAGYGANMFAQSDCTILRSPVRASVT